MKHDLKKSNRKIYKSKILMKNQRKILNIYDKKRQNEKRQGEKWEKIERMMTNIQIENHRIK